jgi:glutathionyl-hydroquinone reductase
MIRKLSLLVAIALIFVGLQAGKANADFALITNGNFATGDLTGWTLSDSSNTFAMPQAIAPQNIVPGGPTGNEVLLGTYGTVESISQTFTATAGQVLSVTFWLANDDYSGTSTFNVLWNGKTETLTQLTNNTPTANGLFSNNFAYNEFQFTDVAAATTTLAFAFQNDNSEYHLTDVNAAPIPAAVWFFGPGLAGLFGLKKKFLG